MENILNYLEELTENYIFATQGMQILAKKDSIDKAHQILNFYVFDSYIKGYSYIGTLYCDKNNTRIIEDICPETSMKEIFGAFMRYLKTEELSKVIIQKEGVLR